MKLHLKLTSVLLSAVMCASMMAPVSVIADETSAPEETQTTEASEKEETKETEKKTPKATEKPEPKESKATETTEPEEKKPAETEELEEKKPAESVKETDPTETEDKKPAETTETEPSHSEEKKPAESNKEEPSEPATTSEPKKEDVPETTVTPETGEKEETHRVPRKNAGTSIASVSITLDAPAVGAKPDYTAVFPSGANYYSYAYNEDDFRNDIGWYDITSDKYVNPDSGVFKTGHQYRVRIYLTAKDGDFTNSTTATLNGQTAETKLYSDQLIVDYTFPKLEGEPDYISSVSITLDAPEVGAKPDYTAVFPSGADYYSDAYNEGNYRNNIGWYDIASDKYVNPDSGVFKAGHQYRVRIYLTAKDGVFTNSTTATLNGQTAETSLYSGQLKVDYTFPKLEGEPDYISSVSITLDAPAVGAKPDYTAVFPSGADYYSDSNYGGIFRNNIGWYDITSDNDVNPDSGAFEIGHQYRVSIYLTAKDGDFTNSTTATLNGQTAETTLSSGMLKVVYTFPKLANYISSVSITLDAPEVGAKPDYTAVFPSGANYYSYAYNEDYFRNDIVWYDITSDYNVNPDSGVFKNGHQYRVYIYLTAKDGYAFTNSTTATLNGQTAETSLYSVQLRVEYTFPKLDGEPDYISSVSITLDAPEVGAKPDYTAVFPSGANYYSNAYNEANYRNDIVWYDITSDYNVNPDSGMFETGHQYRVYIYLTAKDGVFTNSTTATLNGQTAETSLYSGQLRVVYTFPVLAGLEKINSVSVTLGLIDPSVCLGSHFSYDTYFPADANYYSKANNEGYYRNDVAWYDETTESYGNPDTGTFQGGHKYTVIVYLTPKVGYSFTNNTTATLNDKFTAEATLDGERLKVTYTFSPVQGESVDVINSVSCTIAAPVIGSNPVFNANFPVDSKYGKITNSVIWHDVTTNADINSSSIVFECSHQYQVRIDIYADAGYYFNDTTWATLNEQNAEVQKLSKSKIRISYTFPKLGSSIGDVETVDDINYKVTNVNTDGIGTVTLIGMAVKRESVSIPATVEINGFTYNVNRIGTKAFYGDKTIKTVYIGNNIAIIDASAFYGCSNLTKVSGGKVLKTIGSSAFAKCSKLKSFSIASTVLSKIGTYAFNKDSKLKTIYIRNTTKLTKSGVKKSLKGSKVKTVKVKKSKVKKYKKYFKKKNSGRSVKVKK